MRKRLLTTPRGQAVINNKNKITFPRGLLRKAEGEKGERGYPNIQAELSAEENQRMEIK